MTPTQTVQLVAAVASVCPAMRIEESTPDVWHAILGDLDYDDALAAVVTLGRTERWIAPRDIVAAVRAIRRPRLEQVLEPPPVDPDDWQAYLTALREDIKRTASGNPPRAPRGELRERPVRQAIDSVFRRPPEGPR